MEFSALTFDRTGRKYFRRTEDTVRLTELPTYVATLCNGDENNKSAGRGETQCGPSSRSPITATTPRQRNARLVFRRSIRKSLGSSRGYVLQARNDACFPTQHANVAWTIAIRIAYIKWPRSG